MKTKILILLCLLLPALTYAQGVKERKTLTRTFPVSAGATLQTNTVHGTMVISNWDRSEIEVRVEIVGTGNDAEMARQQIDRVTLDLSQSGNTVLVKNTIASVNFSGKYKNLHVGISVNYTILVPVKAKANFDLTHRYGNVTLNDPTQGNFKADIQYGNLMTNILFGPGNTISGRYGNFSAEQANNLTVNNEYGKVSITRAENLDLTLGYSSLTAERIGTLNVSARYSPVRVGEVNSLTASRADYSNIEVQTLAKRFEVPSIRYATVKIGEASAKAESIRIGGAYTNVTIGLAQGSYVQTDLSVRYGNIKTTGLAAFMTKTQGGDLSGDDRYTKTFKGNLSTEDKIPSGTPRSVIAITNQYANIILDAVGAQGSGRTMTIESTGEMAPAGEMGLPGNKPMPPGPKAQNPGVEQQREQLKLKEEELKRQQEELNRQRAEFEKQKEEFSKQKE